MRVNNRQIVNPKGGAIMYALIYDEFEPSKREKEVISVHKARGTAEKALEKRQHRLGKRVWECNTRIVWVYDRVHEGDTISPNSFDTWAPGEKIPKGNITLCFVDTSAIL